MYLLLLAVDRHQVCAQFPATLAASFPSLPLRVVRVLGDEVTRGLEDLPAHGTRFTHCEIRRVQDRLGMCLLLTTLKNTMLQSFQVS